MTESNIQEKVQTVFKETELLSIPVEVVSMANFYGFEVYELEMDDNTSGMIIVSNKNIENFDTKKVIVINSKHSNSRKRFTIAHELGHYILSDKPEECYAHRESKGSYNPDERDVNSFASALLMPKDDLEKFCKLIENDYSADKVPFVLISKVSERYNVSKSAAEVRLKKLNII